MIRSVSEMLGCALLYALGALAVWSPAAAQENSGEQATATARELGHQGLQALERGQCAVAEEKLDRALELYQAPTLFLARARARRGQGKLSAACDDLRAAHDFPVSGDERPAFARARRTAAEELERVQAQLAHLTVVATTEFDRIQVNGAVWSRSELQRVHDVDPGLYTIEVSANDGRSRMYHVALAMGQRQVVTLALPAAALTQTEPGASGKQTLAPTGALAADGGENPRPAATSRTAGYAFGVATAALLAGAVVTGIIALQRHNAYDASNRPEVPLSDVQRLRRDASTWAWLNTGLWAATLASAGVGAYLLLVPDSTSEHKTLALQLGAAGRF